MFLTEWNQEEAIEVAREEAFEEGEEKGRNKANLENAKKMKADNMSVSNISKYTGLSTETINQL